MNRTSRRQEPVVGRRSRAGSSSLTFEHFDGDRGADAGFENLVSLGLNHVTERSFAQRLSQRQVLARELPFRVERQLVLGQRGDVGSQSRAVLLDLDDRKELQRDTRNG